MLQKDVDDEKMTSFNSSLERIFKTIFSTAFVSDAKVEEVWRHSSLLQRSVLVSFKLDHDPFLFLKILKI